MSTTGKSGPWQYAVLTDPDSSSFAVEKANSLRITATRRTATMVQSKARLKETPVQSTNSSNT